MSIDLSQFYEVFFEESFEGLDVMESELLALTPGDTDAETLNTIFRAAHSIKGGSGTFGFNTVADFTHELETLLDQIRDGTREVETYHVDLFLKAVDCLRDMLNALKDEEEPDTAVADEITQKFLAILNDNGDAEPNDKPGDFGLFDDAPGAPSVEALVIETPAVAVADDSDAFGFFDDAPGAPEQEAVDEGFGFFDDAPGSPEQEALDQGFGFFDDAPGAPEQESADQGFGFFDDASGAPPDNSVGIPVITKEDAGKTWRITFKPESHLFKTGNEPIFMFMELAELGEITVDAQTDNLPQYHDLVADDIYLHWQITLVADTDKDKIEEIFEWVLDDAQIIITCDGEDIDEDIDEPTANGSASASPVEYPLKQTQASVNSSTTPNIQTPFELAPEPAQAPASKPALVVDKEFKIDPKIAVKKESTPAPAAPVAKEPKKTAEATSIRVSIEKVDSLINMVGELVITQAMLSQYGEGEFTENRRMLMLEGLAQLAHNTRELQESVMQIRMLPISFVFSRFPRLVRDISQKLGKQVDLKLLGETTELDKTVMEKISDPMVHLIRNSLDHGLETPEERVANGKPATGTVTLNAYHQGGNIVIEIIDDGKGIDPQTIRAKAFDKGLIHENSDLSDQELIDLIFLPGFSTKTEVSDLSGRGVGMDVVRRNIQELNGTVEVESHLNQGSIFTIRLPLTLAILDGQLVTVGDNTYIIPLVNIIESIQMTPAHLNNAGGDLELFRQRDEYIPILRLYQIFNHDGAVESLTQGILVIVESDNGHVGLLVDDLLAQQQVVIKSLEANYQRVEGISGATILGDGTISLIIDIQGVINLAGLKKQHRNKLRALNNHDMVV